MKSFKTDIQGDACDEDKDNDEMLNADDNCPLKSNKGAISKSRLPT